MSFRKPLLCFVNLITIHNSRDGSGAMVDMILHPDFFARRSIPSPARTGSLPGFLTRMEREERDDQIDQQTRDADHYAGDGQAIAFLASPLDLVESDCA